MELYMGEVELELGGPYLGELREATDILNDREALQARMAEDGYLLIRGLHDRDAVIEGRRVLVNRLAEEERQVLHPCRGLVEEGLEEQMLELRDFMNYEGGKLFATEEGPPNRATPLRCA